MHEDAIIALVSIGIGGFATMFGLALYHYRKITEMKLRARNPNEQGLVSEMRELKQVVNELRDTTTRYDISFDAALQRLESRVARVEERAMEPETESLRIGG